MAISGSRRETSIWEKNKNKGKDFSGPLSLKDLEFLIRHPLRHVEQELDSQLGPGGETRILSGV